MEPTCTNQPQHPTRRERPRASQLPNRRFSWFADVLSRWSLVVLLTAVLTGPLWSQAGSAPAGEKGCAGDCAAVDAGNVDKQNTGVDAGKNDCPFLGTEDDALVRGSILFSQGNYAECLKYLDFVIEKIPDNGDVRLLKATALMMVEQLAAACREYSIYAGTTPGSPEGYNLAGKLLFENGHFSEARGFFAEAVTLAPGDAGLCNNLGSALVRLGQLDEARKVFEQGLDLDSHVPELYINIGMVYYLRRDFEAAERILLEAIEINTKQGIDDPVAFANLGDVYLELCDPERAVSAYCQALRCDGTLSDVRTRLGMVLAELDRHELAQEQLEWAVYLGGELPQAHSYLAEIFLRDGKVYAAVREYRAEICMTGSRDPVPLKALAQILASMERDEEALECLWLAYAAGDRSVELLSSLSALCEKQGFSTEALTCFRQLEEQSGCDTVALYEVAKRCILSSHAEIRNPQRGLEIAERFAEQTEWRHVGILNFLAMSYAHLGNYEQAVGVQKNAIALTPPDSLLMAVLRKTLTTYEGMGD